MRARIGGAIGLLALWVSAAAAQAGGWRDHVVLTVSERARVEMVDWFGPQGEGVNADPQRYTFFASQLRAGGARDVCARASRRRGAGHAADQPAGRREPRAPGRESRPFYNLMNNQDLFAQLILRPSLRATLRIDYHWLRVTEGGDLWYAGGGATNDNVFGFADPPAGGRQQLAPLVDFGVNVALMQRVSLYVYYGHALGGAALFLSDARSGRRLGAGGQGHKPYWRHAARLIRLCACRRR